MNDNLTVLLQIDVLFNEKITKTLRKENQVTNNVMTAGGASA
ncbi:hypothetical protein [Virgibacillus sp. MSJ-26]|nr:hypothetical protein [Virgibacillus sp. MSJ-26]